MSFTPAGFYIPSTISSEAKTFLRRCCATGDIPPQPALDDIESWKQLQQQVELFGCQRQQPVVERYQPDIKHTEVAGVPCLLISADNCATSKQCIVYAHGGAFALFSAHSSLDSAIPVAVASRRKVISVDYTCAPEGDWRLITAQVKAVVSLAIKQYGAHNIAVAGDSAGAAIMVSSLLQLRDQGEALPAAVVLWSPWSDLSETGDTYQTLKEAETCYRYESHLLPAARAYASGTALTHPSISVVYSDYTKGFPPCLIQGGTKEIFLSNFVRLYRALEDAGCEAKLDLYEGMPHVFQAQIPDGEESVIALKQTGRFMAKHLASLSS
ncbi:alpha/beta hydrolase fold domain-containing protein [Aliagarivorans taiwanensis]|uniref:alpha/beta hydrolase fold domain-containing protein n=1 Tax=Aliagarivorans taiwanensis TaxID=561966 RepID=UPI000416BEF3|nr:alpha/beta hydrolase [Aliagarivorans taiwanensis]